VSHTRAKAKANASHVIGIDLGGTNVRAAVVDRKEKLSGRAENPSDAKGGANRTVARIAEVVRAAAASADIPLEQIGAIGIAVPGHINVPEGMVVWAPNFGENIDGHYVPYKQIPLRDLVEAELGIAMTMDNDANAAALGEFRYGAGRGARHLVMFTLGTGIGGGIIVEGEVLRGATGGAAEVGHIIIADGIGSSPNGAHGRLETLAGRDPIIERATLKMESGRETLLWNYVNGPEALQQHITPALIDEAAEAGDELAKEVMRETGHYVGLGIASMVNVFNPEVFVLGGKISQSKTLRDSALRTARASAIGSIMASARIVSAELGDNAGIMGAAELAWREVERAG
jgi:glucokinase